jgi:hypothetical protein
VITKSDISENSENGRENNKEKPNLHLECDEEPKKTTHIISLIIPKVEELCWVILIPLLNDVCIKEGEMKT